MNHEPVTYIGGDSVSMGYIQRTSWHTHARELVNSREANNHG